MPVANGISPAPGISYNTGISGGNTGISNGSGISGGNPNPISNPLTDDAELFALTDDAGLFGLTPG